MPTKITRSAKTGKFVTKKAAKRKPGTTVTETVGVTYKMIAEVIRREFNADSATYILNRIRPLFTGPNPKKKKV